MPKRRKKPKYEAEREVRRRARQGIGAPPASRRMEDKRRKPPKHKKRLAEEISPSSDAG